MNDVTRSEAPQAATAPLAGASTDAENPWLGLASFTEETRAYFYGREEEVAELARRVQRKLLTVLFGQSGLGKTSILRAGLVPRLRAQGYCPVYVRIAYARDAPEPAEQIKRAIAQISGRSGEWTQAGVAVAGESLWEFLHHRDDVLRDESGATLIPLLIFDQFEEIFTLAQTDDFGRARAARFIADLADLVENRPPRELEARLEADESAAERFDFARGDYRVLIALREDYLAPLEGLKTTMPSITQNRLRLARMSGSQAMAAVMQPGKHLVSEEVAGAIVRFVAGGTEIQNAEVEPSLLSLICRELNDTRLAQGRSEISLDLLAGSHAGILSNFYERSLADQPAAVRRIIEDELLTESGFRENVAEENLVGAFTAAGALPGTLAVLVNRRLLRVEERLDVRRVELTHDVLCGVVKSSRDLRQEREEREATGRLLAEQQERSQAARKSLVRARQVAAVCVVLTIGAAGAAIFAYSSTQRARHAEHEAQETRAAAEQARAQAEQLLGYLTDDFAREFESFGRLDAVAELAKRQVDYFDALPPALKGPDSIRNGALALVQYAGAERTLGHNEIAGGAAARALKMLDELRRGGDESEATTIAMVRALEIQARVLSINQDPAVLETAQKAVDLLKPVAEASGASAASRRAYTEALALLGYIQQSGRPDQTDSIKTLQQAMRLASDLGARDLSNLQMSAVYAESGGWLAGALGVMGRNEEARGVGIDALAIAQKVLDQRPGYLLDLRAKQIIESTLGGLALIGMSPAEAVKWNEASEQSLLALLKFDPKNTITINNLGATRLNVADALWNEGQLREALQYYSLGLNTLSTVTKAGAGLALSALVPAAFLVDKHADFGDAAGADESLKIFERDLVQLRASVPKGSNLPAIGECLTNFAKASIARAANDPATEMVLIKATLNLVMPLTPRDGAEMFFKNACVFYSYVGGAQTQLALGNYPEMERLAQSGSETRRQWPVSNDNDRRDVADIATLLAIALAGQGRCAQSQSALAPALAIHRALYARNHGDAWQPTELAMTLYAQAQCDKARRAALLTEAASLMNSLPAQMRQVRSLRQWRDRIQAARGSSG